MDLDEEFKKLNIQEEDDQDTIDETQDDDLYHVLSVDVGVINLGITVSRVDKEFNFMDVIWLDLINITQFSHTTVCKENCTLQHTRTFSDWLDHVYQDNEKIFQDVDFIIIEKQPPMGFVVVEQLIFNKYRNKASLINPINVHTFLNMSGLDYQGRKARSEKLAMPLITNPDLCEQIKFYHRQHDICDSLCMLMYWLHKKREEFKKHRIRERVSKTVIGDMPIDEWFKQKEYTKDRSPHIDLDVLFAMNVNPYD